MSSTKSTAGSLALRRASITAESCTGSYGLADSFSGSSDGIKVDGDKQHLVPDVKRALSSVPKQFQQLFYNLNGRIVLSDKTHIICDNANADYNVPYCTSFDGNHYNLVMSGDDNDIENSLLGGLGYSLAEIMKRLSQSGNSFDDGLNNPFNLAIRESPHHLSMIYVATKNMILMPIVNILVTIFLKAQI